MDVPQRSKHKVDDDVIGEVLDNVSGATVSSFSCEAASIVKWRIWNEICFQDPRSEWERKL